MLIVIGLGLILQRTRTAVVGGLVVAITVGVIGGSVLAVGVGGGFAAGLRGAERSRRRVGRRRRRA